MFLNKVFEAQKLDLADWEQYKTKEVVTLEDTGDTIPFMRAEFFKRFVNNRTETFGAHYFKNKLAFIAWGYQDEKHCGANLVVQNENQFLETIIGCPEMTIIKNDNSEAIGFSIKTNDGKIDFK